MKLFGDILKGDKVIWFVLMGLSIFSLLAVWSATGTIAHVGDGTYTFRFILKHFSILALGLGIIFVSHLIDYRYYSRISQVLLVLSIPLLIYTLFFGSELNDANRWITVPVINLTFQTSDLAKIALFMYLARQLARKQDVIQDFRQGFLPLIAPIFIICLLIAPANLSTALVLFATSILILFVGRVSILHLSALVGMGALIVGILLLILFAFNDDQLQEHGRLLTWKHRIEDFFLKDQDKEVPYQVQQANIAIAKGGIFRLAPGDSLQRNYLPHPYSDFIFAIIIEEYGLVGGLMVVLLYLTLLLRCIKVVLDSPKAFGAFLAVGLGFSLSLQALINMGVAVNLLPVTGVTLPLISMGGSSIWFTAFAFGVILSVTRMNEKEEVTEEISAKEAEFEENFSKPDTDDNQVKATASYKTRTT